MTHSLNAAGFITLEPISEKPVSKFAAFKFNVYRYNSEGLEAALRRAQGAVGLYKLNAVDP